MIRFNSQAKPGLATLIAIPVFVLIYLIVTWLWHPPFQLAMTYAVISLITFIAYAVDKFAAQRGRWRTPEKTLHLLSLCGGWPGALLAQQYLRHKSTKTEFRVVFWGTVLANVIGFIVLCSALAQAFRRS
jgi:uncharacterized membrane protein YsdA (DUF1294 family)